MGRSPCCSKEGLNRGAWTALEDKILTDYIKTHGEGGWRNLPIKAGLKRCGKSCRLRWLNYLRPDIKRGNISHDEEELIIKLHKLLGNRWSLIAGRFPGRTDNEIKNYWNTNLSKKVLGHSNSTSSHKSSNQPKEKKKPVTKPSVGTGSRVVRTKALRCTKVFFNPQAQNVEPNGAIGKLGDRFSSFTPGEENSSDFVMDFDNGEDNCLSKLLDSDFSQLCDFESMIGGGECNNENTTDDLSLNSDEHSLLFLDEILHNWTGGNDSAQHDIQHDIQSYVTVLDSEDTN